MFVVHKLAEDVKLLPQELVGEIHLKKKKREDLQQVRRHKHSNTPGSKGEKNDTPVV